MHSEVASDLLQQGYRLRRAAEKFDATRGFAFSTYAYSWISQANPLLTVTTGPSTFRELDDRAAVPSAAGHQQGQEQQDSC